MMMKMNVEEYKKLLEKDITEHQLQVWFCNELKKYNIFFFAIPNGGVRGGNTMQAKITGYQLKQEGVLKGVADLQILLNNGRSVFVEMKTEKGKQSPEQKTFEKKVKELGHNYFVLHNKKECLDLITAITNPSSLEKVYNYLQRVKI